jgi:hypothetical protein
MSVECMTTVPRRYVPSHLTSGDARRQRESIRRSRKQYKKGRFVSRPNVKSFRARVSPHVAYAKQMYHVPSIRPNRALARATQCNLSALNDIVAKGRGAYYSSGSRPNQTADSWAMARLASSVTGGNASVVDYAILKKGCRATSPALRLAEHAIAQRTRRRSPRTKL